MAESERPESIQSGTEGSQSRRNSITHPYRALLEDTSFARCHFLASPQLGPETYTRSLSMLGHGIPLWDPVGSLSRSKKHLNQGVSIGDVGYLGLGGDFRYLFNIFQPVTDSVQVKCPPELVPLTPPEPSNISRDPTYFPPGTALASKGVGISRIAASPLDIKFTIDARESGILILPDGASREDLVSTDFVRDYVHQHALEWYRFINGNSNSWLTCPNGCLYVITGCDKTAKFAVATSGPNRRGYSGNLPTAQYHDHEWEVDYGIGVAMSNAAESDGQCAVIIRGMRVAISPNHWTKYILHSEPPDRLPYYHMLSVPATGLKAKVQTFREEHTKFTEKDVDDQIQVMFHPLQTALKFLFEESPSSDVAVVEDVLWCFLANNSDGSYAQITRLLKQILEQNEVSETNGLVTFIPLQHATKEENTSSMRYVLLHIPDLIKEEYQTRRRRWMLSSKLAKIFPGPGLPAETLTTPSS